MFGQARGASADKADAAGAMVVEARAGGVAGDVRKEVVVRGARARDTGG